MMKQNCKSKAQIYGVYWKYENALVNVWKIIKENIKLFDADIILKKLDREI